MGSKMVRSGKRGGHRLFWVTYTLAAVGIALVGTTIGLIFGYAIDLPRVDELQKVRPNIVSYVYADDGRILGQFAMERRILVTYDQIPPMVRQAVLAGEDSKFFQHAGIDFRRAVVTLFRDIFLGERTGFSTLTMQLSKIRLTNPEKSLKRKITDMLYAIEIEKNYSKEQIFTIYCNQINMGHGVYGLAAGADFYFHKTLKELSVAEAALLVGIIQAPARHSPIIHPEQALSRRKTVLRRMHEVGYIDRPTLERSLKEPLAAQGRDFEQGPAPYFVEWVRQHLSQEHTAEEIWRSGLKVYTTVDYDMQVAASRAIREGLKTFDRARRRWEGPIARGKDAEKYVHPDWRQIFYEGQSVHGVVAAVTPLAAQVRLGSYTAELKAENVAWTGAKRVSTVLQPGDVALFNIRTINRSERTMDVSLDRVPQAQAALLAIDNRTGGIKAMVGGFDFQYSKFNRAMQALRQPGSLFKVFTYVTVLEGGYSPYDMVMDAPVSFRDGLGRLWQPTNDDEEYKGPIPILQALYQSRNVPTVRLANAVGIENVINVAHRFGIKRDFPPYLPVALGAGEVTLLEITSAFSTFPNGGVRAEPYFIKRVEDYNGVTLEEHSHRVEEVLSPETAGVMRHMLTNVVQRGTGVAAAKLGRPMGGKTGTTNDFTDSWFVGFTPQITAGVWAGRDEKKTLGNRVYGGTLALPIWVDFMGDVFKRLPVEEFDSTYTLVPPEPARVERPPEAPQTAVAPIVVEDIRPPL